MVKPLGTATRKSGLQGSAINPFREQWSASMSAFKDQIGGLAVYPEFPGYKEQGGASEAAAKIIAPMLKKNQAEALEALHRAGKPLTADELADFMGKTF